MKSAIYVGTYGKYNSGSLFGKWFDLNDYSDVGEFNDAIKEYHKGEYDPEYMFQDWEGIPDQFISECSIDSKFWDYLDTINDSYLDVEVFQAGSDLDIPYDEIQDRYCGAFESDTDLAYYLVESMDLLGDASELVSRYFDYEAYGRDEAINYYSEHNGHYFNQC